MYFTRVVVAYRWCIDKCNPSIRVDFVSKVQNKRSKDTSLFGKNAHSAVNVVSFNLCFLPLKLDTGLLSGMLFFLKCFPCSDIPFIFSFSLIKK